MGNKYSVECVRRDKGECVEFAVVDALHRPVMAAAKDRQEVANRLCDDLNAGRLKLAEARQLCDDLNTGGARRERAQQKLGL